LSLRSLHEGQNTTSAETCSYETDDGYKRVKGQLYPVRNHVAFHDLGDHLVQWLIQDAGFRQSMSLTVSAYKDFMLKRTTSAETSMHYRATLNLLNARLSEGPSAFLVDSTLYMINTLATLAIWQAQHAEIATHLNAVKNLIRLRGGKEYLLDRPSLKYYLEW
jgi:hypothetical protein